MAYQPIIFEGLALRREAIEEARAAGRMGSVHIPPGALTAVFDPTDTFIGSLETAHASGKAQHSRDRFLKWVARNFLRLSNACADAGVRDGQTWLGRQYTLETGGAS